MSNANGEEGGRAAIFLERHDAVISKSGAASSSLAERQRYVPNSRKNVAQKALL
jgi:hypothetical protein